MTLDKQKSLAVVPLDNIFHCCVQKTGSQWIKQIMLDEMVLSRSGLEFYPFNKYREIKEIPWKLTERRFDLPFPLKTLVSPLYLDVPGYLSIPKPLQYRSFFIIRDPRDIVISWYFSVRDSHVPMGNILTLRERFQTISLMEGLHYSITYLDDFGIFAALSSWSNVPDDKNLLVLRFEDLIDPSKQIPTFTLLFSHCGITITEEELSKLLKMYSFSRLREQDIQRKRNSGLDLASSFRKGVSGDWRNYFDDDLLTAFYKVTGELIDNLEYRH